MICLQTHDYDLRVFKMLINDERVISYITLMRS